MQFQYLADLKREIKKYCGFMNPEPVRAHATEAFRILSEPEISLPIEDASSSLIQVFLSILDNKKTLKTACPLISTMCDCMRAEIIIGDALSAVTRRFENFECTDKDSALKIVQFATRIVGKHFLEMDIFQSIVSMILSFCSDKDELVSETASAAVDQIICSFLCFAESKSNTLTPANKRDIDLCFSLSCDNSIQFENHASKVSYLVIRDIARMCCRQSALWFHVKELSTTVSYGILTKVITNHAELINSSPHFQRLITDAATNAYTHNAPLNFCVMCADIFMEKLPSASSVLFKNFLNDLRKTSSRFIEAMLFFRILLLKNSTVIMRFCLHCDQNAKILTSMIEKLREVCENAPEDNRISLNLSPKQCGYKIQNPVSSAIEIAVYFVHSCYKAQNSALKILVSNTWANILSMYSIASTIVKGDCCHILLQGMHSLIVLTHEMMLEDARGSVVGAFCNVLVAPKGPEADEVKRIAYETVTTAIETASTAFKGHWSKLLTALNEFSWKPASFEFTKSLSLNQVVEIANGLLSINDGIMETREWAMELLVDMLISNIHRFADVWSPISSQLCMLISNDQYEEVVMNAFLTLLSNGFADSSEEPLCKCVEELLGTAGLSTERHCQLLEAILQLLSYAGDVMNGGWCHLLNALRPANFRDDETLNTAFRCVQIIASDMMFTLNPASQAQMIDLILEFAGLLTAVNISLSAFGLLWNIVPVCNTEELWRMMFGKTSLLIAHPTPDVSICAVNTFFSLVVSNSQAIPSEVLDHIARDLFMPIVNSLAEMPIEREATQQLAYHELAHCGRKLWEQFKHVDTFRTDMWKQMITDHEKLMLKCRKREVRIAAFQFYEEVFQCEHLSNDLVSYLFDSMDRLTDFFIDNETANSPLLGSLGGLIRTVLPTQKQRLTEELLNRWIKIIEHTVLDGDKGTYLPATAHKAMGAMVKLCPLPMNLLTLIYESFVKIACNQQKNMRLTDVALEYITEICEEKVSQEDLPTLFIISTKLFNLKSARRLLLNFVEKDIEIRDDMVEHVAYSLMALGRSDSELLDKTAISVLKMFTRLQDETKTKFMETYKSSYRAMTEILSRFCDPSSSEYSNDIASLCTKCGINNLGRIFCSCSNDVRLLEMLKFIHHLKTEPKVFNAQSDKYHLMELLPVFADLVLHPNENVRKRLRKILITITELKHCLL